MNEHQVLSASKPTEDINKSSQTKNKRLLSQLADLPSIEGFEHTREEQGSVFNEWEEAGSVSSWNQDWNKSGD